MKKTNVVTGNLDCVRMFAKKKVKILQATFIFNQVIAKLETGIEMFPPVSNFFFNHRDFVPT